MSYHVGQVIYVLSTESNQVVPIQVVEQVTRQTLEGTKVSYMIKVPHQKSDPVEPAPLEKIKGEIFDTIDEAHAHLRENALRAVEGIIDRAKKMATASFGRPEPAPLESAFTAPDSYEEQQEETSDNVVVLEDGTKAKIRIPKHVEEALANPVQKAAPL